MSIKIISLFLLIVLWFSGSALAQENLDSLFMLGHQKHWSASLSQQYLEWSEQRFLKPSQDGSVRQDAIMNGNKITSLIWNYGSISKPAEVINDIVWEGLGYGYEFGPFVAAEVEVLPTDPHPDIIQVIKGRDTTYIAHIISDGLISNGGEVSPDGNYRWGWQPLVLSDDGLVEYANIDQDHLPTSDDKDRDGDGRPDSWPEGWYNENLRDYVWPGALGQGATNADKEAFFVFDDRDNVEFEYYPYEGDTLLKGLGLEVESRIYQWSNVEAEDAMFLIYKIRNKSNKDLSKVIFGMWGDPHIGGPKDYADDWASFDKSLEMVFAWDENGISDVAGLVPGYLGYKFLESPGLANDNIDNDNDGMIDESWTDGEDNDNDWQAENDDVGIDGVPNTGDEGEKDGVPTAGDPFDIRKPGEPNFEFTDIDESDMLGLTSFRQPQFGGVRITNDELMWNEYIQPDVWDSINIEGGDNVFLYSSGIFPLKAIHNVPYEQLSEAIKRFSIALIIGEDRNDLELNAKTVQRIYNSGYQFAKPPAKPNLTAVPGDRQVMLYWDNIAEASIDPITKENDFEGYVIYRSVGYDFLDQQNVTDVYGNKFLFEPLKSIKGVSAKFDLENDYSGISNIPYTGRGVSYYLGENLGIRNVYVDSNNVINGQTYYYAVVSYDHGSDSLGIPPTECSKIITYNATTDEFTFDVNTAQVVPRRKAAGYTQPDIVNQDINNGIVREEGFSTGIISVDIIDEVAVKNENKYLIEFDKLDTKTVYNVEDTDPIEQTFISFYDNFVPLLYKHLDDSSTVVTSLDGQTKYFPNRDYELDAIGGAINVFDPQTHPGATMEDATEYQVTYNYYPVWNSAKIDSELTNTPFDGLKLIIKQSKFGVNESLSDWSVSSTTTLDAALLDPKSHDPYDYEFKFSSTIVDTAVNSVLAPFTILDVINNEKVKFAITEKTVNGTWDPGDVIFLLRGGITPANITWEIWFDKPESGGYTPPSDNDLYYLATDKPFAAGDIFSFQTVGAYTSQEKAKSQLGDICVVPNPYVATNVIEPMNPLDRSSRGYRRVYFDHLPQKCTIRVFTLAGELVQTIEHDSAIDDGKEFWDLLTRDNMEVAYGLYFFHVDAPGIGETTGKFAVIR